MFLFWGSEKPAGFPDPLFCRWSHRGKYPAAALVFMRKQPRGGGAAARMSTFEDRPGARAFTPSGKGNAFCRKGVSLLTGILQKVAKPGTFLRHYGSKSSGFYTIYIRVSFGDGSAFIYANCTQLTSTGSSQRRLQKPAASTPSRGLRVPAGSCNPDPARSGSHQRS